jgi:aminodeoxyfutalosine deaminase
MADTVRFAPSPKVELHVHLEGTVRPPALLEIARRNGIHLGVESEPALRDLLRFRDFEHFIEMWLLTTAVVRTEADFRQIVVAYAEEAAAHGAVYIEGIFTPVERVAGGASWAEVMNGFCDGAQEAEERTGVIVRLTPDIPRGCDIDLAIETARQAVTFRDRGVVGLGLGGLEAQFPPEPYARAFAIAKDGGLGSVPHAGEAAGPASIRGALDALQADRVRHGIRAVEDPGLLADLAAERIVLDVCPMSNVRTRTVASLDAHPLPALVAGGALCSISTDDPALFDTDLTADYSAASALGHGPRAAFDAGVAGALCDEATRDRLRRTGSAFAWRDDPVAELDGRKK